MNGVVLADIDRDVNSIAATAALPALIVLVALSVPIGFALARRTSASWSVFEWFVGLSTVALIIAVTLFRGEVELGFRPSRITEWSGGLGAVSRDPLGSSQFLLNVALFVPAGAVWTWLTDRPLRVAAALVLGSFTIEGVQAVTGAGANDPVDLVANAAGAFIGVGVAAAGAQALGRHRQRWSTGTRHRVLAAAVVLVVVVATGWFVGASRRQAAVADALEDRFSGTDRSTILTLLETDPEAVFSAVAGRADGTEYVDDRIVVRYPATFFSLHRCVYVTWSANTVEFRKASGDDCTRFLG